VKFIESRYENKNEHNYHTIDIIAADEVDSGVGHHKILAHLHGWLVFRYCHLTWFGG